MRCIGHIMLFQGLFLLMLSSFPAKSLAQVLVNYDSALHENFSDSWLRQKESVAVLVDVNQFPDASWRIRVPEGTGLFFNDALWEYYVRDTILVISNNTIVPFKNKEGRLEITAFKQGISLEDFSLKKGYFNTLNEKGVPENVLVKRNKDEVKNFFFIALIAVLFLIAIFRAFFPAIFGIFWNPKSVFSIEDIWESGSFSKIYSAELLFYLVLINMCTGLLVILVIHGLGIDFYGMGLDGEVEKLVFGWLIFSLMLTIITFLKFIWLGTGAFLFNLKKIAFPHFFYLLKVRGFAFFIIICMLIVVYANNWVSFYEHFSYMYYTFFIIYSLGLIGLAIWLYKKNGFNNYHLFSYLCTSELIPFLVICKLLLG